VISLVGLVFGFGGLIVVGVGLGVLGRDDPGVSVIVGSGLFFAALGAGIVWFGWREAKSELRALVWGDTAKGELLSVQQNTSIQVNGRYPWRIEFSFEVRGEKQVGSVDCWDDSDGLRQPGEPVWVVYDPEKPNLSALWPPHG